MKALTIVSAGSVPGTKLPVGVEAVCLVCLDGRSRMTLRSWIARKYFVYELITMLSILEREERWGICILGVVKYIGIAELMLDLSYRV